MSSVLFFKNFTYYDENHPAPTIEGSEFQALLDLCFAHADAFSLRRCGWPGAKNGALEDALRPWLLGEYFSYGILNWFDLKRREKCYLYRACPETKDILLQHIHHLFDQEISLEPQATRSISAKSMKFTNVQGMRPTTSFLHTWTGKDRLARRSNRKRLWREFTERPESDAPMYSQKKTITATWKIPAFSGRARCFLKSLPMSRSAWSRFYHRSLRRVCASWEPGWMYRRKVACPYFC